MGVFLENPVLIKEIRTRLRANRQAKANRIAAFCVVGVVILLVYYFGFRAILNSSGYGSQDIYAILMLGFELTLTVFLVPSLAAGSITQEREQQTWNALLLSRLSAGQIVWGKFLASLLPALGILLVFAPLNIGSAIVGSVPFSVFALSSLILLSTTTLYAAISLFCSWAYRRTYVATSAALGMVAFLVVGTLILMWLWQVASPYASDGQYRSVRPEDFVPLWLNPYAAMGFSLDKSTGAYLPIVVNILFNTLGTLGLLRLVAARLVRGPKEMEQ